MTWLDGDRIPDLATPSPGPPRGSTLDGQGPLPGAWIPHATRTPAGNNCSPASPTQGSGGALDQEQTIRTIDAAPLSRAGAPKKPRHVQKRKIESDFAQESADALMVRSLAQNALREDYCSLLESELPRWAREGLWPTTSGGLLQHHSPLERSLASPPGTTTSTPSSSPDALSPSPCYSGLERAYQAVCQLDTRMSDDELRNRIALVQLHLEYTRLYEGGRRQGGASTSSTRGRGDASHVIDRILESTHRMQWSELAHRRRCALRAKFHDRKRYGKRWAQLADALGPGILLVCAPKLANAM